VDEGPGDEKAIVLGAVALEKTRALSRAQRAASKLIEQIVFDGAQCREHLFIFEQSFLEAHGIGLGRLPQ
jgi:hypothetical protein